MFSEEDREYFIEDMQKNINFSYQEYTPPVNVYRYGESFDKSTPYILIEFLPANRNKFRSISDYIGDATPAGQYKQYGFCQIEVINIYCYSGEFHDNFKLNGRRLTYHLAETTMLYVQKNWEQMFWKKYASLDRAETLYVIKDSSYYDDNTASKIYCYSFDVYARTQMRWNKIPESFDGEEEICEGISEVLAKTQTEEEFKLIGNIQI
jgi:hypothetical protein